MPLDTRHTGAGHSIRCLKWHICRNYSGIKPELNEKTAQHLGMFHIKLRTFQGETYEISNTFTSNIQVKLELVKLENSLLKLENSTYYTIPLFRLRYYAVTLITLFRLRYYATTLITLFRAQPSSI